MAVYSGCEVHTGANGSGWRRRSFFQEHGHTENPVMIQCYLTLNCGFSCPHCLAVAPDDSRSDMPADLFERLCRESAELGVEEIIITGGEPLHHGNFAESVRCLRRHGLKWTLNTAACPNPAQRAAITEYPPMHVAVSLDGPAEVHNQFRGSPAAFDAAIESISFFSSLEIPSVCVGTTVTTKNFNDLHDTFELTRRSGADSWGIHLLFPEGRAHGEKGLFPSLRQLRRLIKSVALWRREFRVSICDEIGYAGEWEPLVRDEPFFCAAGRTMCSVLPDGSVTPCSTVDPLHYQGNIKQYSLAEIWRDGFAATRSFQPQGKCLQCSDWRVCGGGCWLQRVNGGRCFKSLWKIPDNFRAAAASLTVASFAYAAAGAEIPDKAPPSPSASAVTASVSIEDDNWWEEEEWWKISNSTEIDIPKGFGSKSTPRDVNSALSYELPKFLDWLKDAQNDDGSWGTPENAAILTSAAILAFSHHRHWPSSGLYDSTTISGIKFLVENARTWVSRAKNGLSSPFERLIVVWALADIYRNTRIPMAGMALHTVWNGAGSIREIPDREVFPLVALAWLSVATSRPEIEVKEVVDARLAAYAETLSPDSESVAELAILDMISSYLAGAGLMMEAGYNPGERLKGKNLDNPENDFIITLLLSYYLTRNDKRTWMAWDKRRSEIIKQAIAAPDFVGWQDLSGTDMATNVPDVVASMNQVERMIFNNSMMLISFTYDKTLSRLF